MGSYSKKSCSSKTEDFGDINLQRNGAEQGELTKVCLIPGA